MQNLSFDITDAKGFMLKLLADHDDYLKDKLSSRKGQNCAMTSWHLSEWIFHEFEKETFVSRKTNEMGKVREFQTQLIDKFVSLMYMNDIADGTKHCMLREERDTRTELHGGAFTSGFNRGYNTSALKTILLDGSKLYFEDEIKKVIDFYKQYFLDKEVDLFA